MVRRRRAAPVRFSTRPYRAARRLGRVRRPQVGGLSSPFIIKVDGRNGGSADLVMGYEDIAPGQAIAQHRHQMADEIIFVHQGTGVVELDARVVPFSAGATIFVPKHVQVAPRLFVTADSCFSSSFARCSSSVRLRLASLSEMHVVIL